MQTLTKENFWDSLHHHYPDAVNAFCKWIDEYKKQSNWPLLFNSNSEYQNSSGKNAPAPKFHDIPGPMQFGILLHYFREIGGCHFEIDVFNDDWREVIENAFAIEQQKIRDGITDDPF